MKTYVGVKVLQAEPMTRGEYNKYRGWEIPKDENPEDPGFLVVYPDGYESWSPADVFGGAYREVPEKMKEEAEKIAADFLQSVATRYAKRPPSFQGLNGRRFTDMVAMLDAKHTVEEVAEAFDVVPEFVSKEYAKIKKQRKAEKQE